MKTKSHVRPAPDPNNPSEFLRQHERKLIGELQAASDRYHNMIAASGWEVARRLVRRAVNDGTAVGEDEILILETFYKDRLLKTQGRLAQGAANQIRSVLDNLAHQYGWAVVDVSDVPKKPSKRKPRTSRDKA